MPSGNQDADRRVIAVVAHGRNREIGQGGRLPWHLPDDLKRFRALTWGFPLVMGRRTWDSLPRKPLPGRDNIVVTGSARERVLAEGAHLGLSAAEAVSWVSTRADSRVFIIGGAQIFSLFWPWIDTLLVTWIDADFPEADVFFPEYEKDFIRVQEEAGPDGCRYLRYETRARGTVGR
jgi:dihydrofolate reductase